MSDPNAKHPEHDDAPTWGLAPNDTDQTDTHSDLITPSADDDAPTRTSSPASQSPMPASQAHTEDTNPVGTAAEHTSTSIPHSNLQTDETLPATGGGIPQDVLARRLADEEPPEVEPEEPEEPRPLVYSQDPHELDLDEPATQDLRADVETDAQNTHAEESAATQSDANADTQMQAPDTGSAEDNEELAVDGEDEEDDLESTKVRRQSLLKVDPEPEPQDTPGTTAWHPRRFPEEEAEYSLFDEASVVPELPSRVGARVLSFFLYLIGLPLAWYLLSDAAARFTLAPGNAMDSGHINPAALIEFAGGGIVVIVLACLCIRSSLGALIGGVIMMAGGLLPLAVPSLTSNYLQRAQSWLESWNAFGANVSHHLQYTGFSGTIFTAGLITFLIGLIAILARRDGRNEQQIRTQIEQISPTTLNKGHGHKNEEKK
ncbi:hypothetical protein QS713_00920 [Gleimia hominis]|uniref:Uncharacterized protein n=1 Tax=Gleimia hominis TaxID=595468 RepID=A0ABU3I8C6_9ACTO|nr:hypothetical protein [Gleimia hominis]MDT3766633.1 hypothetical protein [Gleimia hominis]